MKIVRFIGKVLLAIIIFSSCQKELIYSDQKALSKSGWSKDAPVLFDIEVSDTLSACDMMIFVRNTTDYPNQNLWLFVEEKSPDQTIKRDTVQCFLVDNQGRWIGSGIGSLHYVEVFLKEKHVFQQSGLYHYELRHGMRCDQLAGLSEIGVKIQKRKQ